MNSRLHCAKAFSLRAFQNLITRRACQATRYISHQASSYTIHRSCAFNNVLSFAFPDTDNDYTRSTTDPNYVNVDTFQDIDDVRSVSAESDCSDDDLRDDEGLIPIYWDHQLPSIQVSKRAKRRKYSIPPRPTIRNTPYHCFPKYSSPISTPASSVYSGSVVCKTSGEFGGDRAIEETVRWLLDS